MLDNKTTIKTFVKIKTKIGKIMRMRIISLGNNYF